MADYAAVLKFARHQRFSPDFCASVLIAAAVNSVLWTTQACSTQQFRLRVSVKDASTSNPAITVGHTHRNVTMAGLDGCLHILDAPRYAQRESMSKPAAGSGSDGKAARQQATIIRRLDDTHVVFANR